MGALVRLVPDIGERLVAMSGVVESMLCALAESGARTGSSDLPGALGQGVAMEVFQRVRRAVAGTQTRTGEQGQLELPRPGPGSGRWVSADRERDLVPLRPVVVVEDDLDCLQSAAHSLGRIVAAGPGTPVFASVRAVAAAGTVTRSEPCLLVAMLARITGLLDLAVTDDGRLIRKQLIVAEAGSDIVLGPQAEAAHSRELARMMRMISG